MSSKGFTLAEILISVAILGLVGGIIVTVVINSTGLISSQNAQINHSLSLNNANTEIENSLKYASAVVSSYTGQSKQFTTSSSTLIYQIPSINSSKQVIAGKFDTIVITPDPQSIRILKKYLFPDPASSRSSEARVLLTNLSQIKFTYLDTNGNQVTPSTANTIEYTINLSEKDNYGTQESSTSGRINLNNTL